MSNNKVLKNKSQAYGYKYSSLADIANAGFEIPKMRVNATEFGEFIEYLDDKGEWQMGAKVVVPDMKGSNEAQRYGSGLTYARRYTAMLALSLVCGDDDAVETHSEEQRTYNSSRRISFDDIRNQLDTMTTDAEVKQYAKEVDARFENPTEKQRAVIRKLFADKLTELAN